MLAGEISSVGAPGSPQYEQFTDTLSEALGTQLGVSTWRVLILSVQGASLVIRVRILETAGLDTFEPSAAQAAASLRQDLDSGSVNLPGGYTVLNVAVLAPPSAPPPPPLAVSGAQLSAPGGLEVPLAVGFGVFGLVVVVLLLALILVIRSLRRQKKPETSPASPIPLPPTAFYATPAPPEVSDDIQGRVLSSRRGSPGPTVRLGMCPGTPPPISGHAGRQEALIRTVAARPILERNTPAAAVQATSPSSAPIRRGQATPPLRLQASALRTEDAPPPRVVFDDQQGTAAVQATTSQAAAVMQSSPSRTPRGLAIYSNRADAVRTRRCAQRDRSPFVGAANRHATSATTPDARNALAGTATPRQILAFGIHSNRAEAIRVNTAQRLGGLQTPVHVRGTLASEVTPRQALQFGAPSSQEEDLFVRGLQTPVPVRGAIAGAGTSQVIRSQVHSSRAAAIRARSEQRVRGVPTPPVRDLTAGAAAIDGMSTAAEEAPTVPSDDAPSQKDTPTLRV